jgi:hypothetical protein
MLRRDLGGFKWMIVGSAISSVLCTFVFQRAVEVAMLAGGDRGEGAIEAIISGPIYWIGRLNAILGAIPKGWYLQCPIFVSVGIPLFIAGFAMLTSASGRAAALTAISSAALIFIGGKKRETIKRRLCNKLAFWFGCAIVGISCLHALYRISATQGWLGEEALKKYEMQTQGDDSIKKLLLGGRMESFCGILACFDKPIVGFGPWAMDSRGYVDEFLARYGTSDDYDSYVKAQERNLKKGVGFKMIPCHAYITEFWLWYGIFGLIFWLYVIFVFIRYLKQDCWVVPQWFMWIAASIPGYFWGIFFSPWTNRVGGVVFIVACLMARAVRQGRQKMPDYMVAEIIKVESK